MDGMGWDEMGWDGMLVRVGVWGRGKDGGVDGRVMDGFGLDWWESQNCTASCVRWTLLDLSHDKLDWSGLG